jgi:hypothetical protein
VLVERYGNYRFGVEQLNNLRLLEQTFGPKLYELMILVLTHFDPDVDPDADPKEDPPPAPVFNTDGDAERHARNMMDKAARKWKAAICEQSAVAKEVWGQAQNMIYCLDCLALDFSDEPREDQLKAKEPLPDDDARVLAQAKIIKDDRLKGFSRQQLSAIRLQVTGRAEGNNKFWDVSDDSTFQKLSSTEPQVVSLKDVSPSELPQFPQLETHCMRGLHQNIITTFLMPTWCGECKCFLSGVRLQGLQCKDCGCTSCYDCADPFVADNASTAVPPSSSRRSYR